MEPWTVVSATAAPLRSDNVDTDQIIPARYLTAVTQEGMGEGCFAAWRYLPNGSLNPEFVLNQDCYQGSAILVGGTNFGSGSSREHAVWALMQFGFKVVIAHTFADIFYNNALKNGLLPIPLDREIIEIVWSVIEEDPETKLLVDLETQVVIMPDGQQHSFEIEAFRKRCLLQGLDDMGYLLAQDEAISNFELSHS